MDCGFGHKADNGGCKGAWPHGYVEWMLDKKQNLASEADYPYKAVRATCQSSKKYNQGLIDSYDARAFFYVLCGNYTIVLAYEQSLNQPLFSMAKVKQSK